MKGAWRRAYKVCSEFVHLEEAVPFQEHANEEAANTSREISTATPDSDRPTVRITTKILPTFTRKVPGNPYDTPMATTHHRNAKGEEKVHVNLPAWVSREHRAQLAKKSRIAGEEKPLLVTRRDFLEVFTDISVVQGGEFLKLPMEVFEMYGETEPSAAHDVVDAFKGKTSKGKEQPKAYCNCRLVLLAMTLCCQASQEEVGEMLFHVYDVDCGGTMCLVCWPRPRCVYASPSHPPCRRTPCRLFVLRRPRHTTW